MDISFDPQKDAVNRTKHGISLAQAADIEWSDVLAKVDDRADYGEVREIGYAVIEGRLYCVVFTQRSETMHIISLRKANKREVRLYEES